MRLHQRQRLRGPWIAHRVQRLPENVAGHAADQQHHSAPFKPDEKRGARPRLRVHARSADLTSRNAILYKYHA